MYSWGGRGVSLPANIHPTPRPSVDPCHATKNTDKLDEVQPGEQAGSIRVQVIGLLNAIQYLKRASCLHA